MITDEMVEAGAEAIDPEAFTDWWISPPPGWERANTDDLAAEPIRRQTAARKFARAALAAGLPMVVRQIADKVTLHRIKSTAGLTGFEILDRRQEFIRSMEAEEIRAEILALATAPEGETK